MKCYEFINGVKFLVVVINGNACLTYPRLAKEVSEAFGFA